MLSNKEIKKRLLGGCNDCNDTCGGRGSSEKSKEAAARNPYLTYKREFRSGLFDGTYDEYLLSKGLERAKTKIKKVKSKIKEPVNTEVIKRKVRKTKNVTIKNYLSCPQVAAQRIIQEENENRPALPREAIQIRSPPPLPILSEEEREAQRERARISRESRNVEEKQQESKGQDTNLMDELKKAVEERKRKKEEASKKILGSGFKSGMRSLKEHRGSMRDLFIKKYTNIQNYHPGKDTLLNRYIRDYVNQTETQQFLNKITEQQIIKDEQEIQEPSTINFNFPPPPPAPPNQIPLPSYQFVPEQIPRPQLNLLEQIRQGAKLKPKNEDELKLEQIQHEIGEKELIKLGENIDPEEIKQFEKIIDTVDVEALKVEIGKNLIENSSNAPLSMLDQIKQGFKLRKVVNNNNFREEEKDALKEALSNIRSQVQEEEDNNDEWNGEGFRILGGGFSQNYLNKKYGASDYQYTQDNKNRIMELQKQRDFYGF
jgi:hypothetical protein